MEDRDAIVTALKSLVGMAGEDDLVDIARGDHGAGWETHLEALRRITGEQDCRILPGQEWFPLEVIELVSHLPDRREGRAWEIATALMMIRALEDGDAQGNMEFRWGNTASAVLALPEPWRGPILDGYRWLARHVPGWSPQGGPPPEAA